MLLSGDSRGPNINHDHENRIRHVCVPRVRRSSVAVHCKRDLKKEEQRISKEFGYKSLVILTVCSLMD